MKRRLYVMEYCYFKSFKIRTFISTTKYIWRLTCLSEKGYKRVALNGNHLVDVVYERTKICKYQIEIRLAFSYYHIAIKRQVILELTSVVWYYYLKKNIKRVAAGKNEKEYSWHVPAIKFICMKQLVSKVANILEKLRNLWKWEIWGNIVKIWYFINNFLIEARI